MTDNARVVSAFYDAVNARDGAALTGLIGTSFAAEARLIWPASLPYGGTVTGSERLARLFAGMVAAPAPVGPGAVEVIALVDGGDRVAAQLRFDWFAPGSSDGVASGALELWTFVDGRVTEISAYYWDTAALVGEG